MEGRGRFFWILVGIILFVPILYALYPKKEFSLEIPEGKCIEDAKVMRNSHFLFLKRARDEAVRSRKKVKMRLSECRKCHLRRGSFCDRCHSSVNLEPDCFLCHYYPR
jgi:hypothetical protein